LPGKVNEFGIAADRDDLSVEFNKFFILLRQSSEFRCSDEGEVGGVKEQDGPFLCYFLSGKGKFTEIAFYRLECFQFEIRNTPADEQVAGCICHAIVLLVIVF
jgi:hypothetical protein